MGNTKESNFGIMGLGVMGGGFAKNLYVRGFKLSAWTREKSEIETFKSKFEEEKKNDLTDSTGHLEFFTNMEDFVKSLESPRKILLLITSGDPVDQVLDKLIPLLEKGDFLIDGGNEWYKNTERRMLRCRGLGLRYAGMGISGGEKGARSNPCLMFGGSKDDYKELRKIFPQELKEFYVGPSASGHYVKMVHNGIEYALMQLVGDLYNVMRYLMGMENVEMALMFGMWFAETRTYLFHITEIILNEKEGNDYLVDKIEPKISSNGTGKWTAQESYQRGVPTPTIGIAVDMRSFSNLPIHFMSEINEKNAEEEKKEYFSTMDLKLVLLGSMVSIFSQGMHLLSEASKQLNWELKLSEIAEIWSSGNAIVSCNLLNEIADCLRGETEEEILVFQPRFKKIVTESLAPWKKVVKTSLDLDLPVPAIQTSLQYVQVMFSERNSHNLIQAQRDLFGAHTFTRVDKPGNFHHDWLQKYRAYLT